MKHRVGAWLEIGVVAVVFLWLLKLIFRYINIPGVSQAVEGL
jgi:hypothetical protein